MRDEHRTLIVETGAGACGVGFLGGAVARLWLPGSDRTAMTAWGKPTDGHPRLTEKIVDYFAGRRVSFADVPAVIDAPSFARSVYETLRTVAWGESITYGQLAQRAGRPSAARGVGRIVGANPIPLIVPCHRVMGADGKLTGFSAPGGIDAKGRMLDLEGIPYRREQ
jgi:methylated-DNA-[protein]-cysteine S-methyltransferase